MPRNFDSLAVPSIALWASSLILPAAVAEEFSWQVAGRYEDMDAASAVESSNSSVRATWYVSAVDDQAGPYELAPFLNRSSYVTVGSSRSKQREQLFPALVTDTFVSDGLLPDDGTIVGRFGGTSPGFGAFPSESGIDTSEYAVDGRYVWSGTGWYAGANARRSDADMLPDLFFAQSIMDQESAGIFAGKYFGTRTTLELGFGTESMNQELRASPISIGPTFGTMVSPGMPGIPGTPEFVSISLQTGVETETENARLSVRHVGDLGSSTFSLSASIRSSRSDTRLFLPSPTDIFTGFDPFNPPDRGIMAGIPEFMPIEFSESERERLLSLSGVLYPTQALGVRLTFSTLDHDTFGSSDLVGLSANWFFVRNAAIEIELMRTGSRSGFRAGPTDTDAVAVRLLGRF